jgi:hypothetical protein
VIFRAAFVLVPVILAWELARKYRINTLFLDDWAYVPLYEKAVRGGLTLHDFFGGYLEHRPAVARAIAVVTTLVSKGDVRWQCHVAFFAITVTWINVGLLLKRALGGWKHIWLPWGTVAWVLFCPVQWQEFLWPSCHMDTLPLLCLTTSLLVLGAARIPGWLKLVACAACAWLATYSFAAGLTLWVLVPVAVALGYGFEVAGERRRFIFAWAATMAVVLFFYFHNLKNEVDAPFAYGQGHVDTMTHSLAAVLEAPEKGFKFAVTLLGANLSRGIFGPRGDVALGFGCVAVAGFGLGLAWLATMWKRPAVRRAALPFSIVTAYGLCVAGMIAVGRAWASKGVGGSLNNRYACFASAFAAGLVALIAVLSSRRFDGDGPPQGDGDQGRRERVRNALRVLGGALCGLLVANWFYGARMMEAWNSARLRGAVDIHFSALLGLAQDRGQPAQNVRLAQRRAAVMNELKFLAPPLATSLDLDQFTIHGKMDEKLARLTSTDRAADSITVHGFALQTMSGRPPDAVLMTWRNDAEGGQRKIVQVIIPDNLPAFLQTDTAKDMQYVMVDEDRPTHFGRWQGSIKRESLPKDAKLRIEAWVLNFDTFTVREIGEGFTINN